MEEFVRKDIEKRRILFLHAETFYIKGRSVFFKRTRRFYTFDQAESCGRLGRIVRSFGLNRAVVSGGCIYKNG